MSDGNKFDVTANAQQRQQNQLPLEEMGNVLLDAMQGILVCLDNHHIIIDVSKTIKHYFGFEQADIVGLSILLLIEDSERDLFSKFLSSTTLVFDICCVRMMMAVTNEYRQVQVHRKKKFNQDNVDVHSTTPRYSNSVGTILVLILDDSSYIDITLFDVHKQEFYTKMNLIGEITFEDHRGALITGYLPHEIVSQSIFNLVYPEDRLVKLHALWKCVTTGASKLQWRLNARDGSIVFLQTEYKLISNHQNHDIIVARNEVLTPPQRAQFDELQTAWRHQCAADIKGNSSAFKLIPSSDTDLNSIPNGECRICVPSLNMCFSTNKLQSLNILGHIFDVSKSAHPLTIQDYISILVENDKYLDNELLNLIHNLPLIASRYKHLNNHNETDVLMDDSSSMSNDSSLHKKSDSDSIVRGILSNSIKYNNEKHTGDSSSTLVRLLNGNNNDIPRRQTSQQQQQAKTQVPTNPEAIQQQHLDFIKKYKAAKVKLESQLEHARMQEATSGGQANDIAKRNTILNKLSQLENIKNKHLARTLELKRQTQQITTTAVSIEQKDLLNSLFPSPTGTIDNHNSPYYQRNSSPIYRQTSFHERVKTPVFEDFSTPPPSSYMPVNNSSLPVHSYMNLSFQETPNNSTSSSYYHHNTTHPY